MAKTLLIAGAPGTTAGAVTATFVKLIGSASFNATEVNRNGLFRVAGTFSNFGFRTNNVGTGRAFTLRKNGANTTVTVTATDTTAGEWNDNTHTNTIAAGDLVCSGIVETGTDPFVYMCRAVFSATTNHAWFNFGTTNNHPILGSSTAYQGLGSDQGTTTEADHQWRVRAPGTWKNPGVFVTAARATACTMRNRINGANGTHVVTLTGGATGWFEDVTHTDTINSGDLITWAITTGTGFDQLTISVIISAVTSTNTSTDIIARESGGATRAASGTAGFMPIGGTTNAAGVLTVATETPCLVTPQFALFASRLRIQVVANTYASAATLRFRDNGADGVGNVTIYPGVTGWFEDAGLGSFDTISATDTMSLSIVGGTSGSITVNSWGVTIDTVSPTTTVPQGWGVLSSAPGNISNRMPLLRASPFVPKEAVVDVAPAVITADEWLPRWDKPARVMLALAGGLTFVPPLADNTGPGIGWQQPAPYFSSTSLYYQSLFEPPPPPPAADNTITPDKWMQRFDQPPRVLLRLPGGQPFVPKEATLENTTNTVWPLTQGEKARPIARVAWQGYHLFIPIEAAVDNTTNRLWPLTQGEKARPLPRAAPQGSHLFVPKEATLENTVTPDKWMEAWKGPPLYSPNKGPYSPFVPKEATLENTTTTVWPLTFGEKARPLPLPAPGGFFAFNYQTPFVENTQTIDKWQQPLSRSVPIPRTAPQGLWAFGYPYFDDTTQTIDKWQQPLSRAVPIPRPAPQGMWTFGYPYLGVNNYRFEWDWNIQWREPPRYWWQGRPYSPFVPKEATLENTTNTVWPLTQGEKARPLSRPAAQGSHLFVPREATLENTVTPDFWMLRWQGPPKYVPNRGPATPFVPKEATLENTVPGGWWQPLGSKALPIPRPAPLGGQPFVPEEATIENTVPGGWWQPFVGSAHLRSRPVNFTQPTYAVYDPAALVDNTVTIDKWQQPFTLVTHLGRPHLGAYRGGQPFVPREAVLDNTVSPEKWMLAFRGPPHIQPRHTTPIYSFTAFPPNTITGMAWHQAFRGPPRYRPIPTQPWFAGRVSVTFTQTVSAEVEVTVEFHICGWGTETETAEAFVDQNEQTDPWVTQVEQSAIEVVESEQSDPWSEETEAHDEFDEKDECGR